MPPIRRFQKEDIINVSCEVARKEGLQAINARRIAKELKCSIQPIFHNFDNMEDLKKAVLQKMVDIFYEFLTKNIKKDISAYKQVGMNYITFAKAEPKIFQTLFMSENSLDTSEWEIENKEWFDVIKKFIGECTNLKDEEINKFHFKMWIFTHGLATLVAGGNYNLTDKQIGDLLSMEFQALMLLEENQKNR